jgi:hypothetical protein
MGSQFRGDCATWAGYLEGSHVVQALGMAAETRLFGRSISPCIP